MTYKRFYKLFNRLPLHDDEMKERLVQQYTDGRTSSLRAMSAAEYDALCDALDAVALKLRAIQRSGGLNPQPERPTGQAEQSRPQIIYMPLGGLPN